MARQISSVCAVILAVSACGGDSTPTTPTTSASATNRAPVISSVSVTPPFGIADLQAFTFRAAATDADGDTLTYAWETEYSGIRNSGSGNPFEAVISGGSGGTVVATVRVSDDRGHTVSASATAMIGSMNGTWTITGGGRLTGAVARLAQDSAGEVTGDIFMPGSGGDVNEEVRPGFVSQDASLKLGIRLGSVDVLLVGTMDTTGRRIAGVANGSGFVNVPFVMTK